MTLPTQFNYFKPDTIDAALKLMDEMGSSAKILLGGTDLMPAVRSGKTTLPQNIIELGHIKELNLIENNGETINIGVAAKLSDIVSSPIVKRKIPILVEAILSMASLQVRNMGTMGGNICNASPAADTAPPLLVLEAELEIMSVNGKRMVPIDQFFSGPGKTVLGSKEIVASVRIPVPQSTDKWGYYKLGRRKALTLSIISIAALARISDKTFEEARIALGAVGPTPLRIKAAEDFLKGKSTDEAVIEEAARMVRNEVKPISDVRASKEYRQEMAQALTKKILLDISRK